MSNTPIAQIAVSTIKGTEKQSVYPKTIDKAVLTTDKEGNEDTLDNVLIKGIDINGETVIPDENGVIDISASMIESIDTEESQESGGNNVITITETNGTKTSFNVKNGIDGPQGVSFTSVVDKTPNPDGTVIITLSNGDTITLDLNHDHAAYPKYELVSSLPASPDSGTLYLIAAT